MVLFQLKTSPTKNKSTQGDWHARGAWSLGGWQCLAAARRWRAGCKRRSWVASAPATRRLWSWLPPASRDAARATVIRLASSLDAWNALQHAGCSARAAAGVGRRTPEQKRHFYSTPGCVVYTKNPSRATLPGFVLTDTSNAAEHQRFQLSRPQFCLRRARRDAIGGPCS